MRLITLTWQGLEEENTTLDMEVLYRVGSDAHALCLGLGSLEADPGDKITRMLKRKEHRPDTNWLVAAVV